MKDAIIILIFIWFLASAICIILPQPTSLQVDYGYHYPANPYPDNIYLIIASILLVTMMFIIILSSKEKLSLKPTRNTRA